MPLTEQQQERALKLVRELADLSEYPFEEKGDEFLEDGTVQVRKYVDLAAIQEAHKLLGEIKGPWVIASDAEKGYWSNEDGWVFDAASATQYTWEEMQQVDMPITPMLSRWVRLSEAKDYTED